MASFKVALSFAILAALVCIAHAAEETKAPTKETKVSDEEVKVVAAARAKKYAPLYPGVVYPGSVVHTTSLLHPAPLVHPPYYPAYPSIYPKPVLPVVPHYPVYPKPAYPLVPHYPVYPAAVSHYHYPVYPGASSTTIIH